MHLALRLLVLVSLVAASSAGARSLRFFGHGSGDIDRVKIRIDEPADALPGPPADVGATDFTIEFWLRCSAAENPAPAVACGAGIGWIEGNIVLDRDRYNQDRKFGVSLGAGRVAFGVSGDGSGDRTICGTTDVRDGAWHHIAVARRRADGWMGVWVDGALEAQGDGPDGDVSYPDDGVPGDHCGGPCVNSDPFIVLGAEKHDAGPQYPAYSGWLDEARFSNVIRYAGSFTPPTAPWASDASTLALYHFDEGTGSLLTDVAGAPGGPSPGEIRVGGAAPAGPVWSTESPFPHEVSVGEPSTSAFALVVTPTVMTETASIRWQVPAGAGHAEIAVIDLAGRRLGTLARSGARHAEVRWDGRDAAGQRLRPGLYFLRLRAGERAIARPIVVR